MAACHVHDVGIGVIERLDQAGRVYGGVVVAGPGGDAGRAETVQAPGPDLVFGVDGETVVRACVDGFVFAGAGAEEGGVETAFLLDVEALIDVVAELVLLPAAPDVD